MAVCIVLHIWLWYTYSSPMVIKIQLWTNILYTTPVIGAKLGHDEYPSRMGIGSSEMVGHEGLWPLGCGVRLGPQAQKNFVTPQKLRLFWKLIEQNIL
ncbi:hypothetical protein LSM04_001022 [Trypanosoma melophagium]|uniref:uncharacterized protein n=1 Tax=Trypanosoma melophagium TaxID=715481 RepID=UPI00351A3E23|nr:hypothetical protein LSM04_001022 [Trypanosoma melophagium]